MGLADIDRNFQNILIIDFGQLGDVVLSLPALVAVRQKFPHAHIAVITGVATGEVVNLSDLVDEVIKVDRVAMRDGSTFRAIADILRLVGDIRRRPLDLVIDLHSLSETNILAFLSKAKYRLLANRESRSLDILSNFRPRPPREDKDKHLSERYVDVLKPLGVRSAGCEFRFQLSPSDLEYVDTLFPDNEHRTIGLFPGAGHPSRCWSLENFARLASKLDGDGFKPAVFLGPEEEGIREQAEALFPNSAVIIDGLSISQFTAAAARMDAFVTNDTGPMHLAACAGVPILLLLDERAPMTYLPLTGRLEIVYKPISDITVDEAYRSLQKLITNPGLPANDNSAAAW